MPDVATRQMVIELLNVIETLAAENAALRVEIQQLGVYEIPAPKRRVGEGARVSERLCLQTGEGASVH
jgi:hypothetical protein